MLSGYLARREIGRWAAIAGALSPTQVRVHHLAVQHLPESTEPLSPARLVELSGLPEDTVARTLRELHELLGFVAIDTTSSVVWAYPLTVDSSPHHLAFETGERMSAA